MKEALVKRDSLNYSNYLDVRGGMNQRPGSATREQYMIQRKFPIRDDSSQYQSSEAPSNLDVTDPRELEYRAKVYINSLKQHLTKKATTMRMNGKVKWAHNMTMPEIKESVSRALLSKAFQPYTGEGDGRARESEPVVDYSDFARY